MDRVKTKPGIEKIAVEIVEQLVKLDLPIWQAREVLKFADDLIEKRTLK